jgi:hypothetical protein
MSTIPDPEFMAGQGSYDRPQRHFTVRLKPCGCGVLLGEWCDCAEFAARFETAGEIHMRTRSPR